MNATKLALEVLGTQQYIAERINQTLGEIPFKRVSQQVVSNWNKTGTIPAQYIRRVSDLTGGAVTVDQLLRDHENNSGFSEFK